MPTFSAPTRSARRWRALGFAVLLAAGLAACGDTDDDDVDAADDATSTSESASPGTDAYGGAGGDTDGASGTGVVAKDFAFTDATVAPGAEVTFENKDDAPHTMTADDDAFDTGNVDGGASATVTAPSEPGEYAFHCEVHPSMTGTLTVEG